MGESDWLVRLARALCRRIAGLIVASLIAVLTGGCADRMILYPTTEAIDAPGATRQLVVGGNGVLEVWVTRSVSARAAEPEGFVLQFTGNGSRAEHAAVVGVEMWRGWPVEVWTVNYPGYGGSTGPARLRAIPSAALAAYDELAKRAAGRPIFVVGDSLGTTAALHVAAQREVAGVVLRNPPPLRQIIMGEYGWWNLWVLSGMVAAGVPSELDNLANGARVRVPAVFLMAEGDLLVKPEYQQRVIKAYAGEKRVIVLDGAGHNTPVSGRAVEEVREGVRWLWGWAMESVRIGSLSCGGQVGGRAAE